MLLQIETAVQARLELLEHCLAPDLELDEAIIGRVHKGIDAIEALTRDDFAKARCCVNTLACGDTRVGSVLLVAAIRTGHCNWWPRTIPIAILPKAVMQLPHDGMHAIPFAAADSSIVVGDCRQ